GQTHKPAKWRPAVVITVMQTEENVGCVFHARGEERLVDVRDCVRITMSSGTLEPFRVSGEAIRKRTQLKWVTADFGISITIRSRIVFNPRSPTRAFYNNVGSILVDGEIDSRHFDACRRDLRNLLIVLTINRCVTAQ